MFEWILSLLGSLASIGAAIWAYVEAKGAAASASRAEQVRGEMVERRRLVDIPEALSETRRVLASVSRVGPAATERKLRGVDCAEIAREVETLCRLLNEMRSHFYEHLSNSAQQLTKELVPDISALAEAKTFEEKKAAGMRIYEKLDGFAPEVKDLLDDKKERVPSALSGRES